ncbi:hypothetical protein GGI1_17593 [Acidithiobacillus sp. GGI-221]|nr:hypothetical protein GGI1_17593 [Acidithiobacillus sp. GGI-221]
MDGISRAGHQHRIAGTHGRQCQVGDALLGPDGDDGLGLGIELHTVTVLIPGRNGAAQAGTRDTL